MSLLDSMNQRGTARYNKLVHSSRVVKHISELGDSALMPGQGARTCTEHGGHHVFPTDIFNKTNTLTRDVFHKIDEALEAGSLSPEEAKLLRSRLGPESQTYDYKQEYKQDKKNLRALQTEFAESEEAEAALLERQRHRIEERLKQEQVRTASPKEQPPLLIEESKVKDATILEYWQCGRKRQFDTVNDGNQMIDELGKREEMSVYQCGHCPKYHIGHGFGKDSVESQLERAREHWNKYAEKSNPFAFAKGLTD
jgi:hypothetical protein